MSAFNTIALIGRYHSPDVATALVTMGEYLRKQGCAVMVEKETAATNGVGGFPIADYDEIGARADLVVVQGGDGSMLNAARNLAAHHVPLVGVNQGRLGFMTDIASPHMLDAMADILAGRHAIEERTMLAAEVRRDGEVTLATLALNDAVVNKGSVGRLIEFVVNIDGEFVYDLRADGLIVATPTGSTAYALSSDGPILQPSVPGFALVPICPHTLSNRPIMVSDRTVIEISLKRSIDARLHFDGQLQCDLQEGDRVLVRRAEHTVKFVHPPGYSYFAMLRQKLHWSEVLYPRMLLHLSIRDFAIVDRLELEFRPGFTALTGETGAGKSILIDALSLTLGDRTGSEQVRSGAERADVTAEFAIDSFPGIGDWLHEQALEGDPNRLLLRRVLDANGRSRAFINGHAATINQMREAGDRLVDIHGQHAHQSLLRPEAQRLVLDVHAGLASLAQETGGAQDRK